jgi:hypothetical protein
VVKLTPTPSKQKGEKKKRKEKGIDLIKHAVYWLSTSFSLRSALIS